MKVYVRNLGGTPIIVDVPDGAATQADMEAGTSTTTFVVPATIKYSPGVAKVWAYVTVSGGTPTLQASLNVTSITDNGVGDLKVTINEDMSSANYPALVNAEKTGSTDLGAYPYNNLAGTMDFFNQSAAGAGVDPHNWNIVAFGDLP